MYDQNPLLNQLSIDDLARAHERNASNGLGRPAANPDRFKTALVTVVTVVASVLVIGTMQV